MTTNDTVREVFRTNLTKLLKEKNMTQKALADYMGVSTATVSDWKNGNVLPRMDKIDKLCAYFHVNRTDLLGDYFSGDGNSFMQFAEERPQSLAYNAFSDDEKKLIYAIRIMPPEVRKAVERLAEPYLQVAQALNDRNRLEKLNNYIKMMDNFYSDIEKKEQKEAMWEPPEKWSPK